jgi:serine phosphatase RsbU (regulator of sigma subunit)
MNNNQINSNQGSNHHDLEFHAAYEHGHYRINERETITRLWQTVVAQQPNDQGLSKGYRWRTTTYATQRIGGDVVLIENPWLLLADISGHDLTAAMLGCMLVAASRLALRQNDVIATLEHALYNDLERTEKFCTLFAARFLSDGVVEYINLGHPPALVYRRQSNSFERLEAAGPPLGIGRGEQHQPRRTQLQPGDQLIIYSDGITEAQHPALPDMLFGEIGLMQAITDSDDVDTTLARIHNALESWVVRDDVTVAVIQRA